MKSRQSKQLQTLIKSLGSYSHWKTRLPPIFPENDPLLEDDVLKDTDEEEAEAILSSSTLSRPSLIWLLIFIWFSINLSGEPFIIVTKRARLDWSDLQIW